MHRYPFTSSLWRQHDHSSPYPQLERSVSTEVVVIGAGIAGLVCAYELQKRGVQVVLLEALEIGHGTTGHTTGKCSVQHGTIYQHLIRTRGEDAARMYYEFNADALTYLQGQVDEGFDIDLEYQDSYLYSTAARSMTLDAELDAYRRIGIDGGDATSELNASLPFTVEQGLVIRDQAQFHPVKYLHELATRFVAAGGTIYEMTRALDISKGPRPIVSTSTGRRVQANHVVVASHYPFNDLRGLYVSKFTVERSYIIASEASETVPDGMYLGVDEDGRSFRTYWHDGKKYVLIGGEGHLSGQETDTRGRYDALESFAVQMFGVARPTYRWSSQDLITLDRLPYVGQMFKREPDIWVATGFLKWGMTNGISAGRLLADLLTNRENRYRELLSPLRTSLTAHEVKSFLQTNVDTVGQFIKGTVERLRTVDELQLDEGALVELDDKKVGVYRDLDNCCHLVSPTCTHLGCTVKWNNAERSWDCPCHGSRFDTLGNVIEGPATKPLAHEKRNDL